MASKSKSGTILAVFVVAVIVIVVVAQMRKNKEKTAVSETKMPAVGSGGVTYPPGNYYALKNGNVKSSYVFSQRAFDDGLGRQEFHAWANYWKGFPRRATIVRARNA